MNISKKDISCFIFTWNDYYKNAYNIQQSIKNSVETNVINSSKHIDTNWINLSSEAYFNEQFLTALELFKKQNKKIFFHIQSDARHSNWNLIIDSYIEIYNKYKNVGIYSPFVENVFLARQYAYSTKEKNIKDVNFVDETVWFIDIDLINIFYDMKLDVAFADNFYGWGYDKVFCVLSRLNKKSVILDKNFIVNHPPLKNYSVPKADKCFRGMLNNLPSPLKKNVYDLEFKPKLFEFS